MKLGSLRSLDISSFEISSILSEVLLGLADEQVNISSAAARDKICSVFLSRLNEASEVKSAG